MLRRQSPGGCSGPPGDRRRARRDVRVPRSSVALDTARPDKFPRERVFKFVIGDKSNEVRRALKGRPGAGILNNEKRGTTDKTLIFAPVLARWGRRAGEGHCRSAAELTLSHSD
jgi:hypothetical protein